MSGGCPREICPTLKKCIETKNNQELKPYTLATKLTVAETGNNSATKSIVADTVDCVAGFGNRSATT